MKRKKNLTIVTGGNGLLGNAIRSLKPRNTVYLTRKDVDLTDFHQTKAIFRVLKPTRVIHLAAEVAGIGGNMIHSGGYFRNNVLINVNVLEAARLSKVNKLISFMSTCVFPDKCEYPLSEENLHNGAPHPSNFGYAYAKRMLEVQSSAYRKEWKCNYIVAIPANMYGPHDFWNIEDGHVIPSLIHKCSLAKKHKTDWTIWGTGKPLREFIYAKDIARLTLWALENYNSNKPIIFSSGKEISIKDLVKTIAKHMNYEGKIIFDKTKPDGQYRKPSNTKKLKKFYPNFRFTSINKGLSETIKWFKENYPKVRM